MIERTYFRPRVVFCVRVYGLPGCQFQPVKCILAYQECRHRSLALHHCVPRAEDPRSHILCQDVIVRISPSVSSTDVMSPFA